MAHIIALGVLINSHGGTCKTGPLSRIFLGSRKALSNGLLNILGSTVSPRHIVCNNVAMSFRTTATPPSLSDSVSLWDFIFAFAHM